MSAFGRAKWGEDYEDWDEEPEPRHTRRYNCGGFASYYGPCGATDCESCYPGGSDEDEDREETMTTSKVVTARKARFVGKPNEIRPGDRVRVTSGFTYKSGGERTGYLRKSYQRLSKGPAWTVEITVTVEPLEATMI